MKLNPVQTYALQKAMQDVELAQKRLQQFSNLCGLKDSHNYTVDWDTGKVTDLGVIEKGPQSVTPGAQP